MKQRIPVPVGYHTSTASNFRGHAVTPRSKYSSMGCNQLQTVPPASADCYECGAIHNSNPCLSAITILFSYACKALQSAKWLRYSFSPSFISFPDHLEAAIFSSYLSKQLRRISGDAFHDGLVSGLGAGRCPDVCLMKMPLAGTRPCQVNR